MAVNGAVTFIHENLCQKNSPVKGQTPKQVCRM